MVLWNRNKKKDAATEGEETTALGKAKGKNKPSNSGFRQQRMRAWQPILTPRTVLPTLFIVAILFAPIGGVLIWGSNKVTDFQLDYTNCDEQSNTLSEMPSSKYTYSLSSGHSDHVIQAPQWSFATDNNAAVGETDICTIHFTVPYDLPASVFLYYKLTTYYQNHRRYVRSLNPDQLHGDYVSQATLDDGDCKPITSRNGKPVYPCGLIANSMFNDTFGQPVLLDDAGAATSTVYGFTDKGITWSNEYKKYTNSPNYPSPDSVVPPPNWALRYPNGYTDATGFPQLRDDEHFQVWMRTAGLPTFRKLYYRNDQDTLAAGRYAINIRMNYPVKSFKGTKSIVISTVSWIGGKNPFLGWAYIAAAGLFVLLGLAGTARHLIKPRRLGDMSLLSWNQPSTTAAGAR